MHHFGNSSGNVPHECQVTLAAQHYSQRAKYHTSFLSALFSFHSCPCLFCLIYS